MSAGLAGLVGLVGLVGVGLAPMAAAQSEDRAPNIAIENLMVPVGAEPDGESVELDVTVYSPPGAARDGVAPAILLGHGFGGSKKDMTERATALAERGYVVLAWTARGFGESGGRVHLNDPAFEGEDVKALIDLLAERPDVLLDEPGDPRVGIMGGSYGGAIGLIGAGVDPRIDTVVSAITWNDLAASLFPQSADPGTEAGPARQLWISRFFGASLAQGARGDGESGSSASGGSGASGGGNPASGIVMGEGGPLLCGRFDPTVCRELVAAAETGTPSEEALAMLRAHSPAAVIDSVDVPVFLIQGMADSLFGLDQSDATARALAAREVPFAMRWIDGGHDGPSSTATQDDAAVDVWLDHYLKEAVGAGVGSGAGSATTSDAAASAALPVPAFTWAGTMARRAETAPLFTSDSYPGLTGATGQTGQTGATGQTEELGTLRLLPPRTSTLITPPGGAPASITTVPGLGSLGNLGGSGGGLQATGLSLPTYPLAALPGQSLAIDSRPALESLNVVGSPQLTLRITSSQPEVTLFASLWQVQGQSVSQPRRLVAPLRVPVTPGQPTEVTVSLPAATWQMPAGSTWRVLLTSTDSAYANAREARLDRIEVIGNLTVPTLTGTPLRVPGERDTESIGVAIAIGVVLLGILGALLLSRRRRAALHSEPEFADIPLVVTDLVKTYADGHRAVDDVSWRAEKGQVVGLLGPNGAGKTTTIRMILGLIKPDSGTAHVMGEQVGPGSPILGRVGALVEGPGFLPHLTGRENLKAYWRATGRPEEEAGFDEALAVAALGGALDRPMRTYSHGMKQRLGIAQAMLGLPELLILDEPTNGLDPPQIAAMRPILHAYAAAGRTVVISSHLLGEVEQTCSHVVVMHAGRVVTTGAVADLISSEDTTVLELGDKGDRATAVAERLRRVGGIRTVDVEDDDAHGRLTVVADRPRGEVVREALDAGADVVGVGSRRHLEEVFLGVIADAAHAGDSEGTGTTMIERLRQVRAR